MALFLSLDLQFAVALAGLGDVAAGLAGIDRLIARFADCDHPLLQGMLHETRAQICWQAKRFEEYQHSLNQVERAYRATGTPALIAKYEQLASLANVRHTVRPAQPANSQDLDALETLVADEQSGRRTSGD